MDLATDMDVLSPGASDLARRTLAWCDLWWDEAAGLARAPDGAGFGGPGVPGGELHLVPQSAWYAFGLLLRNAGNDADRQRARRILETLLTLQYDEPGAAWNGSFARFAESPRPPPDATVWVDYDPNWRQFMGTAFLCILHAFPDALPDPLVRAMEGALRRMVEGEPPDRVPPSYANIALMKAWLEVEAGARLGEPAWIRSGEALAEAVTVRFDEHGAFDEYNSPTYYGVDLFALALWARSTGSPRLATAGPRLAAALWRDLARWYHAGLRNLCGPYTRTYGMDLGAYVAMLSLWLWRELGAGHAPLPPLGPSAEHGHDLFLGPLVAALGSPIPPDAQPAFLAFDGPRTVRQTICRQPLREASGFLDERWMAGAEHCGADLSWWDPYVAATLHWRLPDGSVGWLALRAPGPVAASADASGLSLSWGDASAREVAVRLRFEGWSREALPAGPTWSLPGLDLRITGSPGEATLEADAACVRLQSVVRDGRSRVGLRVVPVGPG